MPRQDALPDDGRFDRLDGLAGEIFPPDVTVMTSAEILERLRELTAGDAPGDTAWLDEQLLDRWLFADAAPFPIGGDRYVDLHRLVADTTFTHRLTAAEIDRGRVRPDPDLQLVRLAAGGARPLAGGGELVMAPGDGPDEHGESAAACRIIDWLQGPEGWLEGYEPGDLLVVTLRGDRVELGAQLPAVPERRVRATVEALRRAHATQRVQTGRPVQVPGLLLETLAGDPEAFAGLYPPLVELLDRAGLRCELGWVLAEDEQPPREDDMIERLLDQGFDEGQATAAWALTTVIHLGVLRERLTRAVPAGEPPQQAAGRGGPAGPGPHGQRFRESSWSREDMLAMAEVMRIPQALELALDEAAAGLGADVAVGLRYLADLLREPLEQGAVSLSRQQEAAVSGPAHYARAVAAEWDGDPQAQDHHLRLAWRDAELPAAAWDLAWLATVRSDPVKGLQHLREVGAAREHDWVRVLTAWAQPGPASAERNDPCPCGSGRKHKACCGPMGGWPLRERLRWASQKVRHWLRRRPQLDRLLEAADQAMAVEVDRGDGHAGTGERAVAALQQALGDPLLRVLVAYDGRSVAAFADTYAPLLPADELAALRDLEDAGPGVYEVADLDPGRRLVLADLVDGGRIELAEQRASQVLREGMAVLTVLGEVGLPDGEPGVREPVLLGTVREVPPEQVASVVGMLEGGGAASRGAGAEEHAADADGDPPGPIWQPGRLYGLLAARDRDPAAERLGRGLQVA